MNQMYLPPMTKVNKYLLIALVGSFVILSILQKAIGLPVSSLLALSAERIGSGFIWQLVTYPLVNFQVMGVVFTGLLLWFIGSDLETLWGTKKYMAYVFIMTVFSGVGFLILSLFMSGGAFFGMSFLSSALCVSYAVLYPNRVFQFFMVIPVKAKYFCMILAGISVYQGLIASGGATALTQLLAMGLGYLFIDMSNQLWFLKTLQKVFSFGKGPKTPTGQFQRKKKSSHLSLVEDDDQDKPPRYWQ